MNIKFVTIFVMCGSKGEARRIADALIRSHLIACANIISGVKSIFWWKGKIDKANEALLIMKTKRSNFARVEKEVKRMHSYEVPEIIALDIAKGSREYLRWIDESVRAES